MSAYGPVIPGLRYEDAPGAIDFLVKAFGLEEHLVVPGDESRIEHAQLSFGTGMVMLGSQADDDAFSGLGTSSGYVVVEDANAHHSIAVANGAEILFPRRARSTARSTRPNRPA